MQLALDWSVPADPEAEFYTRLRTHPITIAPVTVTVDGGGGSGQGKRVGAGTRMADMT
jgi:hypothetical protein